MSARPAVVADDQPDRAVSSLAAAMIRCRMALPVRGPAATTSVMTAMLGVSGGLPGGEPQGLVPGAAVRDPATVVHDVARPVDRERADDPLAAAIEHDERAPRPQRPAARACGRRAGGDHQRVVRNGLRSDADLAGGDVQAGRRRAEPQVDAVVVAHIPRPSHLLRSTTILTTPPPAR